MDILTMRSEVGGLRTSTLPVGRAPRRPHLQRRSHDV